jgi:hypothetical protein
MRILGHEEYELGFRRQSVRRIGKYNPHAHLDAVIVVVVVGGSGSGF